MSCYGYKTIMALVGRILNFVQWCDRNILIPVTITFVLGISFSQSQPSIISEKTAIISLVLLIAAAISFYCRQSKFSLFLCLPLFFLIGNLNILNHAKTPLSENHIYHLLNQQSRVTLVGTLTSMVEQNSNNKSRFEIDVQELLIHGRDTGWQSAHGRVRLSIRGWTDNLQPGDTLMIVAKAGRITNFKTPGAFDYKGYMATNNVYISGWIKDRRDIVQVTNLETLSQKQLRYLPEQVRQKVAHFLSQHLDHDIAGLYQALLVGSRAEVSPEIQEQFKATGTMHLLAISGIHMGLLGLMIGAILNWLLRRSRWLLLHAYVPSLALLGTLPILLGYAFIAGMNTPVLRALIMATILLIAVILRREHSMLHLVAAAALMVLTLNPPALFTVSFQLSFSAVTALALFFPQLFNAAQLDAHKQGGLTTVFNYIKAGFLVSIIATLGTLPFMLLHFNRFSPIGPVMNLLVEPFLCFWALPWGLAAIPMIFIAPQAAILLLKIGGLGIVAGQHCTAIGSEIPYASLWTITPTTLEIFVYGLLLLLLRFRLHSIWCGRVAFMGSLLLLLHFTSGLWFVAKQDSSQITYLEVGQGTSTFLHLPDGSRILFDGGGNRRSSFNVGERIIAPYLWKQRIWKLDQAIISHPHSDHFNGMGFVLAHFQPGTLYINGDKRVEGNYSEIIDQARQQGIELVEPEAGQDIVRGENHRLTIIGMNGLLAKERNNSVNDKSLVMQYTHGQRSFLFPADISRKSENILIRKQADITADVLLAPHHGSATSNSRAFIEAVNPSLIVVSAGKNGQKYYPAPTNLAFWKKQLIQTRITRDHGTITCTTDGRELSCTDFASNTVVLD